MTYHPSQALLSFVVHSMPAEESNRAQLLEALSVVTSKRYRPSMKTRGLMPLVNHIVTQFRSKSGDTLDLIDAMLDVTPEDFPNRAGIKLLRRQWQELEATLDDLLEDLSKQ